MPLSPENWRLGLKLVNKLILLWYSARRYQLIASLEQFSRDDLPCPLTLWYYKFLVNLHSHHQLLTGEKPTRKGYFCSTRISSVEVVMRTCMRALLFISEEYPFLGTSPDAAVYDPSMPDPFGLAGIKCPFSLCNLTRMLKA